MRMLLAAAFSLLLPVSGAFALELPELPFDLGFQIGFDTTVVPDRKDASKEMGLGVVTEQIITDKVQTLTIVGTLVNYGGIPCEGVEMRFAVTSYTALGKTFGRAEVEPDCIPPQGTARFVLRLTLDNPDPRHAYYTITARNFRGAGAP